MVLHYFCPKCNSYLRVLEYINLTFKSKEKQGVILLHPEIGNYQFHVHDTVSFEQFEKVDFYCPVCFKNLKATEINENLASIKMLDDEDRVYDVFFSRIAGEHSTFKIDADNIIEEYGEDKDGYLADFKKKLSEN